MKLSELSTFILPYGFELLGNKEKFVAMQRLVMISMRIVPVVGIRRKGWIPVFKIDLTLQIIYSWKIRN